MYYLRSHTFPANRFNRTILELKLVVETRDPTTIGGFNRTILELKLIIDSDILDTFVSFNRTILELKRRLHG